MRIAFDLRRIQNLGIGRYMSSLVETMVSQAPEHDYLFIMAPGTEGMISVSGLRVTRTLCKAKYYSIAEQIVLPKILKQHRIELLHSPHFLVPLVSPCPVVATVHDVVHIVCKDDLRSALARVYARVMMKACARVSHRIITDSDFSRQDIVRVLGVDADKVDVVYPGAQAMTLSADEYQAIPEVRQRFGITDPVILYAGIYRRRKNHIALLRAFADLTRRGVRAQLVIAGPMFGQEEHLRSVARELGIAEQMILTGFVSDLELKGLYGLARVYACPSLYEGFGFTVLEAMSCAVPVVAAPYTCIPEIGGRGALYANPDNTAEFAEALSLAMGDSDLRDRLIANGYQNLNRFSWERAAKQTLEIYSRVVGAPVTCVVST